MMKKLRYITPQLEIVAYQSEKGYATSVVLEKDDVLINVGDGNTLRNSEEITEYTDSKGEYDMGSWGDF